MKIAQLFVNLGIQGANQTQKALKDVKGTLGEISTQGLAVKAGLLGAMYGMEQMMTSSMKTGNSLRTFAENTGLSMRRLQQFDFATRQAGGKAGAFQQAIESLQNSLTEMSLSGQQPKFLGILSQYVGAFKPEVLKDPFAMILKLQEFVHKAPPSLTKNLLGGIINDDVLKALHEGKYTDRIFKQAPIISERQANQLEKVNVVWSNIGQQIEMAFAKFTAKHGVELASNIGKIAVDVLVLVDSLTTLAENLKVFDLVREAFQGWEYILKGIQSIVDVVNGKTPKKPDLQKSKGGMFDFSDAMDKILSPDFNVFEQERINRAVKPLPAHNTNKGATVNQQNTTNNNVNVTNHQVTDAHAVGREVKKQLHKQNQNAGRQFSTIKVVN